MNTDAVSVGLEIELLHQLALDLGVDLELMRIGAGEIESVLADGLVDVVVGGIPVTPINSQRYRFADSHMDETLAFLVADEHRSRFSSSAAVARLKNPWGILSLLS